MQLQEHDQHLRLTPCQCVRVDVTAVDVQVMWDAARAQPYVFANAGHSVVVQRSSESDSSLLALRVHGGDNPASVCVVNTPDAPHSLAWVSAGGQLQFGTLELSRRLRWDEPGAVSGRDKPLPALSCLAYHPYTRLVVGACQVPLTDDPGCSTVPALALVDPATQQTLHVVPMLSTAAVITAVAVVSTRCLTERGGSESMVRAASSMELVLVASCSEGQQVESWADGHAEGHMSSTLSVFQVNRRQSATVDQVLSSRVWNLVLLGAVPLNAPCHALADVMPERTLLFPGQDAAEGGDAADSRASAAEPPADVRLLVLGCEDGVHLCRMSANGADQRKADGAVGDAALAGVWDTSVRDRGLCISLELLSKVRSQCIFAWQACISLCTFFKRKGSPLRLD